MSDIEVQKMGFLHWEWRYHMPRYRLQGNWMRWTEYATGTAMTRWGALRKAKTHRLNEVLRDQSWVGP